MSFGMEIFNSEGIKVLSTSDFTMRLIYREKFPAVTIPLIQSLDSSALRSTYLQRTIPGYNQNKCVVMFVPTVYSLPPQNGSVQRKSLPTYVNLGGNVIGIRNYCNNIYAYSGKTYYRSYGYIVEHWLEVYEYV